MLLAAIIILLVAAIAYYHYAQGFFSSLISAFCAVIAAVIALGLHENLEAAVSRGRFADEAAGATMVVLFAAVYLILRLIFDSIVPGNVRVAVWLEKGGAAVLGIVAGIFATGVAAVALQTMPLGPSILYYSNYALQSTDEVAVPLPGRQAVDSTITNELVGDSFQPDNRQSLLLPVDNILVGMVEHLSNGGSLEGSQPLSAVHPDLLQELFGQRLGIQVGGKHTAIDNAADQQVRVIGVYDERRNLRQVDGEYSGVRVEAMKFDPVLSLKPKQVAIVVRIVFSQNAADKDHIVRFSTGSIHLVANGKDYYPVGTLQNGTVVYRNKPTDYLFINTKDSDAGADLLFIMDEDDLLVDGKPIAIGKKIPQGVFISVKRLANIELGGMALLPGVDLENTIGSGWTINVMRREGMATAGEPGRTPKR